MSIKGHSLTLVKGHSDFKVKCLTFGLYNQVSDSGPQGPLVQELPEFAWTFANLIYAIDHPLEDFDALLQNTQVSNIRPIWAACFSNRQKC